MEANSGVGQSAVALSSFIKIGFVGVGLSSITHLLLSLILSWLSGADFATVVYVTAATIITGSFITFLVAFLVTLNIGLTAAAGLAQGAQSFFGGGGSTASRGNPSPFFPSTNHFVNRISDLGNGDDDHSMKLD